MRHKFLNAEKNKIRRRLKNHGVENTKDFVSAKIFDGTMPTALSLFTVELLLKQDENGAAGCLLKVMKAQGQEHPLVDELYSSWLWCAGRRKAALAFALKAAKKWMRPYLFNHGAALQSLIGDPINERKFREYAAQLAREQMGDRQRPARKEVRGQQGSGVRGRTGSGGNS